MASNQLPTNSGQVIDLSTQMEAGLTVYGSALKIAQITPAGFQLELAAFIAQDNSYNAARSSRQTASDSYQAAIGMVADWLQVTKNVLTGRFGNRWSTEWAQAGFINPSIAIPSNAGDQLGLAVRLVAFFTANPSYEVASMNVTAAQGTSLRTAALTAQQSLAAATVTLNTISGTWQTVYDTLTASMRALIKILGASMGGDDPRWLAFGLNMPATTTTPGKPVNVTAHMDSNGNIVVQCDAVPLATRYRTRMLLVGVQTEYQLAARSVDPVAVISDVVPGQTAQIIVQAVNGGLQGVPSEPIQITVLLTPLKAAEAKAPAAPVLEIEPMIVPAHGTNGSRNRRAALAGTRS